jgi:CRP-like cAMP-binding protein
MLQRLRVKRRAFEGAFMSSPFRRRLELLKFLHREDLIFADRLTRQYEDFDKGRVLLQEGGRLQRTSFVLDGWAIRYKTVRDGGRQILNFILPGDVFGLYALLFDRSEHAVEAITPMTVGSIPATQALDTLTTTPRLGLVLAWMAGRDERILDEQIVRVGRRHGAVRMAHLLVELHVRLARAGLEKELELPLNQILLSDALGISHVHAHRLFRQLESKALIERRGQSVALIDLQGLAELAGFDVHYLTFSLRPRASGPLS